MNLLLLRWMARVVTLGMVCGSAANAAGAVQGPAPETATDPSVTAGSYRGWTTLRLHNGLVEVQVAPEIGGRIIQFKLGHKEFLWVNPDLAGTLSPMSGLAVDGGWLNYGGDKLWPAPQGWDNDDQWPGPPDAVLDGQPYTSEVLPARPGEAAVRLISREDRRSGIQFSRVIRIFASSTRVEVVASMKNIDARPRRWGIWAHTQLDAAAPGGTEPNRRMKAWCPVNPRSRSADGYEIRFGAKENPSFRTDWRRGLVRVDYRYQVGKIGVDSPAGWSATVDGLSGAVFVQRFDFDPNRPYPDDASVEFWHNGVGKIYAYNREMEFADDPARNPFVFESELLSPFCELQPGETCAWRYEWRAANLGGDFPVLDCTQAGLVAEPLEARPTGQGPASRRTFTGRFGVFAPGQAWLQFLGPDGLELETIPQPSHLSTQEPPGLSRTETVPAGAAAVELVLAAGGASQPVRLARTDLRPQAIAGQWSKERAWNWYDGRPWLVGCNFLPSTAVNDVQMWEPDGFDPATIRRELGWARDLGFNCVRVFLNFVVWQADAQGLKRRFARFLELADEQGISVMPILFDDCNFAGRVAAAGKQPDPVPGVHNSQWVSSPPLAMVTNRQAWPALERYAKDMVAVFGRDRRVTAWDLYNEPGNSGMHDRSLALAEAVFAWARVVGPEQPLTIGVWADFNSPMSRRLLELSDVVSFHGYDPQAGIQDKLAICRTYDRPILCTEWLHRQSGNTVEAILPLFHARQVGCFNWGLVYGRTQTFMPWGSQPGTPVPALWQHDLFHPDGTPFRQAEVDLICDLVKRQPSRAPASLP